MHGHVNVTITGFPNSKYEMFITHLEDYLHFSTYILVYMREMATLLVCQHLLFFYTSEKGSTLKGKDMLNMKQRKAPY